MSKSSRLKAVEQMVAEARERTQDLSTEEVATEIESGDALLVDLRECGFCAASGDSEPPLAPFRRSR